jgi:DnaJ-class molecular chaperone
MPRLRNPGQHGNLLVEVNISVPTQLSEEELRLYEQLAALRREMA